MHTSLGTRLSQHSSWRAHLRASALLDALPARPMSPEPVLALPFYLRSNVHPFRISDRVLGPCPQLASSAVPLPELLADSLAQDEARPPSGAARAQQHRGAWPFPPAGFRSKTPFSGCWVQTLTLLFSPLPAPPAVGATEPRQGLVPDVTRGQGHLLLQLRVIF